MSLSFEKEVVQFKSEIQCQDVFLGRMITYNL